MKNMFGYARVIVPFIWIGFICSISFMESWIKFTAPNVSLLTGLSIGHVVFSALNKVELLFAIILALAIFLEKQENWRINFSYLIAVIILFTQSIWILPFLSGRIDVYQAGNTPPPSSVHLYFVALEVLKTAALFIYGIKQLTLWKTSLR